MTVTRPARWTCALLVVCAGAARADGPAVVFPWSPQPAPVRRPITDALDPLPRWSITPKAFAGFGLDRGQNVVGGALAVGARVPSLGERLFFEVELQGASGHSQQHVQVVDSGGVVRAVFTTELSRVQGAAAASLLYRAEDLLANYASLVVGGGVGLIASSNRLAHDGGERSSTELRPSAHFTLAAELANVGPGSLQAEARLQVRGDAPVQTGSGISLEVGLLVGYRLWFR